VPLPTTAPLISHSHPLTIGVPLLTHHPLTFGVWQVWGGRPQWWGCGEATKPIYVKKKVPTTSINPTILWGKVEW